MKAAPPSYISDVNRYKDAKTAPYITPSRNTSTSRESESGLPVFMRVTLCFVFAFCKCIEQRGTLLVAQLVEALRYKLEGRGFDSRWCQWIFFIDIILPAALWP